MRKIIVMMFTVVCFSSIALNAMAYPVEVISSNSHVWGDYDLNYVVDDVDDDNAWMRMQDSYDNMGSTPQSGGVNIYYDHTDLYAISNANLFDISVDVRATGWWSYLSRAGAIAQTDTIFKPLHNFNTLNFSYDGFGDFGYSFSGSLIDLTDNVVIWNISSFHPWWHPGTDVINYNFQSDHLYSVHLYTVAGANTDGTVASFGFKDLKAVPEPLTLFLLSLGLIGLVGIERKVKK